MKPSPPLPRPGRPRAFDEEVALARAMEVFWRQGYDAASLADLTAAMGINPPSLYAAFGNKEALYLRVLERYGEGMGAALAGILSAPTAREVARRRLQLAAEASGDAGQPAGCLLVQAVARCDTSTPLGQKLVAACDRTHEAFVARFKRAKKEGDLPKAADPQGLARYLHTVSQGLALQAAAGTGRALLKRVAELALAPFGMK